MTIELEARITLEEPLTNVLAHAERYLAGVPHSPFVIEAQDPALITVGPFPVASQRGLLDETRTYKDAFSAWDRGFVTISTGRVATIFFQVCYRAHVDEVELGTYQPTDDDRRESEATAGYCVRIKIGRTKASFGLAALVICAVAERNGTRILDDAGRQLRLGRLVNPDSLAAIFVRHVDVTSFEEFADAFCDEVGFSPSWPDSVTLIDS